MSLSPVRYTPKEKKPKCTPLRPCCGQVSPQDGVWPAYIIFNIEVALVVNSFQEVSASRNKALGNSSAKLPKEMEKLQLPDIINEMIRLEEERKQRAPKCHPETNDMESQSVTWDE